MQAFIFVFDPDIEASRFMVERLRSEGFEVLVETDSSQGIELVVRLNPGVVLMSDDMPSVNGAEVLSLLRRRTSVPIIAVGAGTETDVVAALLQGADMYIQKPYPFEELVSRVRALVRRSENLMSQASWESDSAPISDVLPANVRSSLTDTETRLFLCLMEKCGRVVGHDELMTRVWGRPVKKERLRFYVYSLRQKLRDVAPMNLHTRNGVGYQLDYPAAM